MQLPALLCCTLATATATIVLTRAVVPDRVIRLRSLDCASDLGERGVCMFAWHCSTSGGTHLATCIDGFFFGSCCRLPSENAIEEPGTNKTQPSVTSDPLVTPGASAASTTPTTPYPKTKPLLKESYSTLPAASPNIQKVPATTLPTPESSATTLQESAKTTLSIRESTTIRPTQELATTTLATQESIETTTTECATTSSTQGVSLTTLPSQESFTTSLTTQESFTTSLTTQESFTTSLTTQESFTTAAPTELPATDSSYEASTDGGASVDQEPTEENLQVMGEGQQQPTEGTQSETAEKDQQTTDKTETTEQGQQETTEETQQETPEQGQQETAGEIEKEVTGETQQEQEAAEVVEQELLKNLSNAHHEDVCGQPLFRAARIVGGNRASFAEWPWQASIRVWRARTYMHVCGGALLTSNWVVTAAHCTYRQKANQVSVVLGEYDLETVDEPYAFVNSRVETVIQHPFFNSVNFEYDIALLRLRDPVAFQPNILPVCLPKGDDALVGGTGVATGWGRLYSKGPLPSVLQKVELPIVSNAKCTAMFLEAGYREHIPDIFLCAGYKEGKEDTCEGDSGGPLVVLREGVWTLAGISSWGKSCAKPNQPGVYTRVSKYRDFIERIIRSK